MTEQQAHFDRLCRCCLEAKISKFLKATIEIPKKGCSKVSAQFNSDLTQNSDFLHGAILFEVADTAGFVAANSVEERYSVLTVDYHMNFLRPVQGEGVYALGEVSHSGKTLIVANSKVYTTSNKLVALGQGTYIVSKILLSTISGYSDE